jgi:hypothetical protein
MNQDHERTDKKYREPPVMIHDIVCCSTLKNGYELLGYRGNNLRYIVSSAL